MAVKQPLNGLLVSDLLLMFCAVERDTIRIMEVGSICGFRIYHTDMCTLF